jgi:hypothetical protein
VHDAAQRIRRELFPFFRCPDAQTAPSSC